MTYITAATRLPVRGGNEVSETTVDEWNGPVTIEYLRRIVVFYEQRMRCINNGLSSACSTKTLVSTTCMTPSRRPDAVIQGLQAIMASLLLAIVMATKTAVNS